MNVGFIAVSSLSHRAALGCIIDALRGMASRNEVLEIRQYFNRADMWERRAIILKNVKVHSADDLFAVESFDPKKK